MSVLDRINRLRARFAETQIDALLIIRPENRRYISGFTGSSAHILVHKKELVLFTDFRYVEQAGMEAPNYRIVKEGSQPAETIAATLQELEIKRLGFEKDFLTYQQYEIFREKLAPVELVPTAGLVEELRMVKEPEELELIAKAQAITDEAFAHILEFIKPGMSERAVALELEMFMKQRGASNLAFEIIVAAGAHSSLPHAKPDGRLLKKGDFVKMDFGAQYQGYCSDMTRTVVLGQPDDKQKEIYQIVLEAQLAALKAIQPGKTGEEIDRVARDIIASHGYGENFGHGLGHGVGLFIHEEPRLSSTGKRVLEPGNVVTVEPGIYLPNWGGVRIEDMVMVTSDGCQNFTRSPKHQLLVID